MKKILPLAAAGLLALSTATAAQVDDGGAAAAINANRVTLQMAQAALKHQENKSDNLVISPYNAMTNMTLVAAGAGASTADEFAKTFFNAGGDTMGEQVKTFTRLNSTILDANKGRVTLLTANGIWVNKDAATLSEAYNKTAAEDFGASVSAEDFKDSATVGKINDWAGANTKGLITKVIEELQPDAAMVLASALYFKGTWTHKFDKSQTQDRPFTEDGAKGYNTPTMHQDFDKDGDIRWQERSGYEAAYLTYGTEDYENSKYPTMRIVLLRPTDANTSARDWLAAQDTSKAAEWLDPGAFENARGVIELPHLDMKQHFDLVPVLKDMGIKQAFEKDADFRPMVDTTSQRLFISAVSHDVVFKTDEEGSEAAAVTTATMAGSAMPREPKIVNFKLDRSFIFALQDARTGTVLFLGAVNKPNEDMKETD